MSLKTDEKIDDFVSKATLYAKELMSKGDFGQRGWFQHSVGSIYFRSTSHYFKSFPDNLIPTLDIATIDIKQKWQGKGVFTKLIKSLRESTDKTLFVESTHNERLADHLKKVGWSLDCPINKNFFLKKGQVK